MPEKKPLLLACRADSGDSDNCDADYYLVLEVDEERARELLDLGHPVAAAARAAEQGGVEFCAIRYRDNRFRVFTECPWNEDEGGGLEDGWHPVDESLLGDAEGFTGGSIYADGLGLQWAFGHEDWSWLTIQTETLGWRVLRGHFGHLPRPRKQPKRAKR